MTRSVIGACMGIVLSGVAATQAGATDLARCPPPSHHHRHVATRIAPHVVYGRTAYRARPRIYNYEDNGHYDGADVPQAYGQAPSWLDGYGTRPVSYGRYGTFDAYGGSAQVWPRAIPPAGGLAVYSPGAYGPGPSIIRIPDGY